VIISSHLKKIGPVYDGTGHVLDPLRIKLLYVFLIDSKIQVKLSRDGRKKIKRIWMTGKNAKKRRTYICRPLPFFIYFDFSIITTLRRTM